MAQEAVDKAVALGRLDAGRCLTARLPLVGAVERAELARIRAPAWLVARYGWWAAAELRSWILGRPNPQEGGTGRHRYAPEFRARSSIRLRRDGRSPTSRGARASVTSRSYTCRSTRSDSRTASTADLSPARRARRRPSSSRHARDRRPRGRAEDHPTGVGAGAGGGGAEGGRGLHAGGRPGVAGAGRLPRAEGPRVRLLPVAAGHDPSGRSGTFGTPI